MLLEQKTAEYSLILKKSLGKWVIRLTLFEDHKTVELHEETNRLRAEGIFWYLLDHSPDTVRRAKEIISRENQG